MSYSSVAEVPAGRRGLVRLPTGCSEAGGPTDLVVHVLRGTREGPTLAVVALLWSIMVQTGLARRLRSMHRLHGDTNLGPTA